MLLIPLKRSKKTYLFKTSKPRQVHLKKFPNIDRYLDNNFSNLEYGKSSEPIYAEKDNKEDEEFIMDSKNANESLNEVEELLNVGKIVNRYGKEDTLRE